MEAGPELDALVAKAMGWHLAGQWWVDAAGVPQYTLEDWSPSTDWEMAGEVVEKMGMVVGKIIGHGLDGTGPDDEWCARLGWQGSTDKSARTAPTGPHAICLAALAAKGEGVEIRKSTISPEDVDKLRDQARDGAKEIADILKGL